MILDFAGLAIENLRRRRLRTVLTLSGVAIGIGALVSMLSFGRGMQKNVTDRFQRMDLFNSMTVLPSDSIPGRAGREGDPDERGPEAPTPAAGESARILDDAAVAAVARIPGVVSAFPDVNFPAGVRLGGREEFRLVQVVPAAIAGSRMLRIPWGTAYAGDDADEAVVSRALLRRLGFEDPARAVGRTLTLSAVAIDAAALTPEGLSGMLSGGRLPFGRDVRELRIAGVSDLSGFGGPNPFQNDVLIPPGAASRIRRLPFSSVWDLFRMQEGRAGYAAVNVRISSPRVLEGVKAAVRGMGFSTFALADQLEDIRRAFLIMDMILGAVGMIAIVVASLGIVNTMVMSVLERTREIGVLKAVGASDLDIQSLFIVESGAIGAAGGILGFGLGWVVSLAINRVVNYFLARQGIEYIDYFSFPAWLFAGAILFAVVVSLAAGIYPARRAARVDPATALRHD